MFIQNRMTGVDKGFVCHSAAARTFLHSMLLIMMEYPSRSNLNCFLSFNEASAKGGELFGPTVIVDITLAGETIILAD